MPRLAGKTAIITGAGSGIGRAIAVRFAEEGAAVAILERDLDAGQAATDAITGAGGIAGVFECDVANQARVEEVFDNVQSELGTLNVLVNNAGIAHVGSVETTTEEDMDRLYAVNVKGVYNCLKAGVARMKEKGGAILNLASAVSTVGIPDRFAYSATKGAVLTMTLSVATDCLAYGIRCNCVAPGRVHTPFVDGYLKANYPGKEQEMFDKLSKTQPIGRMGKPEEIASLALYLCSDESGFVTGTNVAIDGGFVSLCP